jgi:hypothetical protein
MLRLADLPLLTDKFPANHPENLSARILRQGLAISAFASLEKYLEARVEKLVQELAASTLSSTISDQLRRFVSVDAVLGLANQLNFQGKSTQQAFVDSHLPTLAKYAEVPATYTAWGFSPKGSNVNESDVSVVLSAFCIEKPWNRMAGVAAAVGDRQVDLKTTFTNLARTRNKSAHNPAANIPTADLKSHLENTILIGVCFDFLATTITRCLRSTSDFTKLKAALANDALSYRFVDEEITGTWVEKTSDGNKVRKRYSNESDAIAGAVGRGGNPIVVVRDTQLVPLAVA